MELENGITDRTVSIEAIEAIEQQQKRKGKVKKNSMTNVNQ